MRSKRSALFRSVLPIVAAALVLFPLTALAGSGMGTAFTYRGQLAQSGAPYTGACDFTFSLWDAASAGVQIGAPQTSADVSVSNGAFAVSLDFGASAFTGDARWLETSVRCPAGSGSYTTLTPRQGLSPMPYALFALNVDAANISGLSAGSGLSYSGGQFSISSGSITNAMLTNPSLTLSAGSGLTGGGTVNLGGTTTLSIPAGGISNAMLASPAMTITAGSGLSGGGLASLGGATTLSIGSGAITSAMLSAGAVGTTELKANAVTAAKVDPASVQVRVNGICPAGLFAQGVGADGSVTCGPVQLSGVITGTGFSLTGAPWPTAP